MYPTAFCPIEQQGVRDQPPATTKHPLRPAARDSSLQNNRVVPCRNLATYSADRVIFRSRVTAPFDPCWRGLRHGFCSTRAWAISGPIPAGSPTASCPTERRSPGRRVRCSRFSTRNYATATWQQQIGQAATLWENATNVNLARVSDGGQADGTSGNQQDDSRFGDIRIGAIPLPSGVLAVTLLPPTANGGTDAGDILLNSNVNWQINSNYDLMTVVAHEFGHAAGSRRRVDRTRRRCTARTTGSSRHGPANDIAGVQSIYGTPVRQFDVYNSAAAPSR